MEDLNFLKEIKEPVFYLTNDVSRGIGLEKLLPNYHIVCLDDHPLVDYLQDSGVKVFCLERALKQKNLIFRSTGKIIDHPLVLDYLERESQGKVPQILFFKPSAKIDFVCQKFGFNRLGNSSRLNKKFEDKVNFYDLCRKEGLPIPEGEINKLKEVGDFEELIKKYGRPLVIQFGRGWAGSTTFFVKEKKEFEELKEKFGQLLVKITRFIKGKTLLNNACLFAGKVLLSPPAVQIPAFPDWTSLAAATCGRQWPSEIEQAKTSEIDRISEKVGQLMSREGYQGFFGLDFLLEEGTNRLYLSENNARLTASVPFFTKLEIEADEKLNQSKFPLLAFHLLAFLSKEGKEKLFYQRRDLSGSEIVFRNKENFPVLVQGSFLPGVYSFTKDNLNFKRKEYFASGLTDDEIWITTAALGRKINPEVEIGRMILSRKVFKNNSVIDSSLVKLVETIKKSLSLGRC